MDQPRDEEGGMKEIEVREIIRWEWECPDCGDIVEPEEDPRIYDNYYCEMCGYVRTDGEES